jgi:hypothetical protein
VITDEEAEALPAAKTAANILLSVIQACSFWRNGEYFQVEPFLSVC